MIVFELVCDLEHRFEGWFASSDDFERQQGRGLHACPICGSAAVRKLLTAKIGRSEVKSVRVGPTLARTEASSGAQLSALIDHVLLNTEDVGVDFASEARRMHAQEIPIRGIRGQASSEESEALIEEGIPVYSLPIPHKGRWN